MSFNMEDQQGPKYGDHIVNADQQRHIAQGFQNSTPLIYAKAVTDLRDNQQIKRQLLCQFDSFGVPRN
jgi:hypothetical protein